MLVRDTVKNLPKKFEDKYLTLQIFYHISFITLTQLRYQKES